jgi:hypothetical protein
MIEPRENKALQPSTDRYEDDFNSKPIIELVTNTYDEEPNHRELEKKYKKKKSKKKKSKNRKEKDKSKKKKATKKSKSKKKEKSKEKDDFVLEMVAKIANLEISVKQLEQDNEIIIAGCKKLETYQRRELLNKLVETEDKSERKRLAGNSLLGGM